MPARKPNILFLMTDQMQGRVLEPDHPCQTPNLDRLAEGGVRLSRAYTPNAVCSPARASLMTGLLPHSHGVVTVTHCTFDHECNLQEQHPHFAQRLVDAGYRTGYFGKWHVERSEELERFGWQTNVASGTDTWKARARELRAQYPDEVEHSLRYDISGPEGYPDMLLYGVHEQPAEARGMGVSVSLTQDYLGEVMQSGEPWCCFVSVTEPHDPYVTSREFFERYDVDAIEPQPNWDDDLAGRPNLYRKAQRVFAGMTQRQKKEAAACYYASITEIDDQFGRLIDQVEAAGQLDDTIVVVTTDHGDFLGAHGLYQKNVGAYEEAYNIPLVFAGPGIASGEVSAARAGLQDVCPTLLDLVGAEPIEVPDSRSIAPALRNPAGESDNYRTGYAEYYGTRYWWTQRILWEGPWKLVWNGFDFDELYNLEDDPYEVRNLVDDPAHATQVRKLMARAWKIVRDTDDHPLADSRYAILRLAPYGPGIADDP